MPFFLHIRLEKCKSLTIWPLTQLWALIHCSKECITEVPCDYLYIYCLAQWTVFLSVFFGLFFFFFAFNRVDTPYPSYPCSLKKWFSAFVVFQVYSLIDHLHFWHLLLYHLLSLLFFFFGNINIYETSYVIVLNYLVL